MLKFLGWSGTVINIVGSFLIAFKLAVLGYVLFLIGAVCWLYVAIKNRDSALAVLNLAYVTANIIGLINYA